MRRRRWPLILIVALTAGLSLAGCSNGGRVHDGSLTVERAKASTLAAEDEIVSLVPTKYVADREQKSEAHLFRCSGTGYSWPGHTTVKLRSGADREAIIDAIVKHWAAKPGYSVSRSTTKPDNEPRITIQGHNGATYYVEFWYKDTQLQISSFSPCFNHEPGQSLNDTY
ncbi:MAG TPA: hypothetical protein VN045_00915 [Microbacteriaceae bacterium]|jgi:hypothetical protein|nr:hypothetical protein [Microbacteriaceae bacterium]